MVICAEIITRLQTIISRKIDPFQEAVITIGSIHAGHASNIIPDTASMLGTARALTMEMREYLEDSIQKVVRTVCECYGAEYDYRFIKLFPPLINDEDIAEGIYQSAAAYLNPQNCIRGGQATMAGEDFAYFSQQVPSALFKLGCRNEDLNVIHPIHSPLFDMDERSLKYGVMIFSDFAMRYLGTV